MTTTIKNLVLAILSLMLLLTSCTPQMYQVLETASSNVKKENNKLYFENADLKIQYLLWAEDGRLTFNIYNKTADPIYFDWNKSHFILDGISNEYWHDSEDITSFYSSTSNFLLESTSNLNIYSQSSKTNSTSKERRVTSGFVNKMKPKKIIQIPPMSSIIVSKFSLIKIPYFTCEFPIKTTFSKDATKKIFTNEESPLKFRNYLTYSYQENFDQSKIIDNDFFVNSVSNMNEKVFNGKILKIETCNSAGYKIRKRTFSFPYKQTNAFYIKRK